jgi:protein arginine kinase activator
MKCQMCEKQATVHLTEIVDGEKTERHLCEECAQTEGITIKTHVPINELLNNLMTAQEESGEISELRCPQCDMNWTEFRKGGLLGCPNDYLAFDKVLRPLIERAHQGANVHVGRIPQHRAGAVSQQAKLLRLRLDLQRAVDREDYEVAARIRDEIKQLDINQ